MKNLDITSKKLYFGSWDFLTEYSIVCTFLVIFKKKSECIWHNKKSISIITK